MQLHMRSCLPALPKRCHLSVLCDSEPAEGTGITLLGQPVRSCFLCIGFWVCFVLFGFFLILNHNFYHYWINVCSWKCGWAKKIFHVEGFAVHNLKIYPTIEVNLLLLVTSGIQNKRIDISYWLCGVTAWCLCRSGLPRNNYSDWAVIELQAHVPL